MEFPEQICGWTTAFPFSSCPDLLGEVVSDERQIDLINQLIADEGSQHTRLKFREFHAVPFFIDEMSLEFVVAVEALDRFSFKVIESVQEGVEPQRIITFRDDRMYV